MSHFPVTTEIQWTRWRGPAMVPTQKSVTARLRYRSLDGGWSEVSVCKAARIRVFPRAQLFEGRLALNPGLNFTWVSFSFVQKHFLGQFSLIFIEHRIINLLTKRTKLNLLYKLSYLNSNFALTLGYLNPALNNPAQNCSNRQKDVSNWEKDQFALYLCSKYRRAG